jgi:hypothetical protein
MLTVYAEPLAVKVTVASVIWIVELLTLAPETLPALLNQMVSPASM